MKKSKLIYKLGMRRSKKAIIKKYGKDFYKEFNRFTFEIVTQVIEQMPDIGNTIFLMLWQLFLQYAALTI